MKKYVFIVIVIGIVALGWRYVSKVREAEAIDALAFSNTAEWDATLYAIAQDKTVLLKDWENRISIPAYSANSSQQTKEELQTLLAYKSERTPERLDKIKKEILLETTEFGGRLMTDYFDPKQFPKTAIAFQMGFHDLDIILMKEKERFDRVRPHILEPAIAPAIEVPGHPAYPSGHSTQIHFVAYLLTILAPDREEEFFKRAAEIARDREIAGLHYSSDSEAGRMLARQVFDLLLEDTIFINLLEEAKEEWILSGDSD